MSLPLADACAKASTRDWKRSALPIEMSPICFNIGITFSAATPNPRSVCAPLASGSSVIGVFTSNSRIAPNSSFALSVEPSRVAKEISSDSISPLTCTTLRAKFVRAVTEKYAAAAVPIVLIALSIRLLSFSMLPPMLLNSLDALFAEASNCAVSSVMA